MWSSGRINHEDVPSNAPRAKVCSLLTCCSIPAVRAVGIVIGGMISLSGLFLALSGAFALGNLLLLLGPVIWGMTIGFSGDSRNRPRMLAWIWGLFAITALSVVFLRGVNGPLIIGAPVMIGTITMFCVGSGHLLSTLIVTPWGRDVAGAAGRTCIWLLGLTAKFLVLGAGILLALAQTRRTPDAESWEDQYAPQMNPNNLEHYCEHWQGPGSNNWHG